MDWPVDPGLFQPHQTVNTFDRHSGVAGFPAPSTLASATWPTAKRALLFPVRISAPFRAVRMYWVNGAAVSGNLDAGIYDLAGTLLANIGSTAQSGTTALQSAALTAAVTLAPGTFYLALVLDNTTGTTLRVSDALRSVAHAQVDLANLPFTATVTPVRVLQDYVPVLGMSSGSTP